MNRNQPSSRMKVLHEAIGGNLTFVLIVLVAASLACNLPASITGQVEEGRENVETKVAQTVTTRSGEKDLPASDTTLPPPSATPAVEATETPTLTPTQTLTPTPEPARVHVSGDTFCRTGPGSVYDQRGVFNTDQESEIIAKDPTEGFWYVVNPDNPAERCWIWGEYATPEGPTAGLPVYTPPPTPTPSLNFSFDYVSPDCGTGQCQFWFEVKNTGGLPLESVWIHIESKSSWAVSTPTKEEKTTSDNLFYTSFGGSTVAKINVGKKGYTHSGVISNPSGYQVQTTMKICSKDGLGGACVTKSLTFNP